MITPVFCSKEPMTRASMPLVNVVNGGGPITFMFLPRHKKASAGPTLRMSKGSYRFHFPWSSCWFSFLPPLWVIAWPYRQILRCKWTLNSIHSIPYILQPHPTLSQMEGTSISGPTVGPVSSIQVDPSHQILFPTSQSPIMSHAPRKKANFVVRDSSFWSGWETADFLPSRTKQRFPKKPGQQQNIRKGTDNRLQRGQG